MLEAGFTTVGEFHYLHHDVDGAPYADLGERAARVAAAAAQTRIGLTLLPSFYACGGFGGASPATTQRRFLNDPERFLKLVERTRAIVARLPQAQIGIAPHSLRAVTPDALRSICESTPAGPIHIHVAEQEREVDECRVTLGRRPVEWLLDNAELGARWCLIHATHTTPAEIRALAASGVVVGLCPLTEASLGDGIFDATSYLAAGGRFGIGSDSNIQIDAAAELRQLEYCQRLARRTRNVLTRREGESTGRCIFDTVLAGGAKALQQPIGVLAEGFRANIVVLNENHPDLALRRGDEWLDAWIFMIGRKAVRSVLVGGQTVVEGGDHVRQREIEARYRTVGEHFSAD
jgi:formiminoglutamate deiminase